MASHRIVCTTQKPAGVGHDRAHIVEVGIGSDPDKASSRMTLAEVLSAMDSGDTFYTKGKTSGKVAQVTDVYCSCGKRFIRSNADAVTDNNLDNLRACNWG